MSRTYRRCIWDCRTEWERNENGHLIDKNEPPNYRVRVPDNFAFTWKEKEPVFSINYLRSLTFAEEDLRMAEF